MSWLNNSLNSIKGQLTTLAQEVLAETAGPGDDEYVGPTPIAHETLEILSETQKKCDELNGICDLKDKEIAMLQKQISCLQNKIGGNSGRAKATVSASGGRTSQSPSEPGATFDDSWCWEPEKGRDENNDRCSDGAGSGNRSDGIHDTMADVSFLDAPPASDDGARGKATPSEWRQRVQHLEAENRRLSAALEELDVQHTQDIHNILQLKQEMQEKLSDVSRSYEALKKEHATKYLADDSEMQHLRQQLHRVQQELMVTALQKDEALANGERDIASLQETTSQLSDVRALLAKKDADNLELLATIKEANQMSEEARRAHVELQTKLDHLGKELDELKSAKEKKNSESSATGSTGKHSDDEFIVVRKGDGNSSGPTTPPSKEALKDKIVQLETRLSELTLANSSLALKLQDTETGAEDAFTESHCETLRGQLECKVTEFRSVQEELWEQRELVAQLKDKAADAIVANEKLKLLTQENRQLAENIAEAQQWLERSAELEGRLLLSEQEKESLQVRVQEQDDWMERIKGLEGRVETLLQENQKLKMNAEVEAETFNNSAELEEKFKALAEDNEAMRLELEALAQAHKFGDDVVVAAAKGSRVTDLDDDEEDEPLSGDRLRSLLAQYLNGADEGETSDEGTAERTFTALRDRLWQMDGVKKQLERVSEELMTLQDGKLLWLHEKKTLEADMSQYILQCNELMKNNEILLNELDNYKRNKLETISENNEENILQLESQLEECTRLNRSLEQESVDLHEKVDELEREKQQLTEMLRSTQTAHEALQAVKLDCQAQWEDSLHVERTSVQEASGGGSVGAHKVVLAGSSQCRDELETQLNESAIERSAHELKEESKASRLEDDNVTRSQLSAEGQTIGDATMASGELQTLRDAYETLEGEYDELRSGMETLKGSLRESEARHEGLTAEIASLRDKAQEYVAVISALVVQLEAQRAEAAQTKAAMETLASEKGQMVVDLQQRHAEAVQAFAEVQRLQQLAAELQRQLHEVATAPRACSQCAHLLAELEQARANSEKQSDQISFLKQKADILSGNLVTEQSQQKLLQQEKATATEQNASLHKDLERLRAHLLHLEEMHTQEAIEMQRELEQVKAQLASVHEDAKKSSTAYTSASIRANQHAETLQAQYGLLAQQRDDLAAKLDAAEDRESRNQAALCNLQCALEQFQNDKEKDIAAATLRLRRDMHLEQEKRAHMQAEMMALNQQLADAQHGLRAASRLSDQLEASQQAIAALRKEGETERSQRQTLQRQLETNESSLAEKIDKSLVKSLLIGYLVSDGAGDKAQILRMIASVLDFTADETERSGLNRQQNTSWLGALLGGGPTTAANLKGTHSRDNLVQAFVHFLEQESQPKADDETMPNLLSITQSLPLNSGVAAAAAAAPAEGSDNAMAAAQPSRKSSLVHAQPQLLNSNVLEDFAPARNSSSILKDILNDGN